MSMIEYVKSLLPTFGQDRLVDDLSRLRAELHELVLPSLEQAEKAFHGKKFKSKLAKDVEHTLQGRFKDHSRGDLFQILTDILKDAPGKVDALEKLVEECFAKDVVKEAITYRKASILKYTEVMSFALHYTVRMALRIIAAETNAAAGGSDEDATLSAAERQFLDDKYIAWLDALVVLDRPTADLDPFIMAIPDVTASVESAPAVEAMVEARTLDPMKLNMISPSWNPIYHVRSYLAEIQVASINRAKEERKLVELRLHELKLKQQGQNDARVEKQIELVEERLKKIDFKIAKLADEA